MATITILVGVFVDLTAAIFAGVVLSLLPYTFVSARQFTIVALARSADGDWEERSLPAQLPGNRAT